MSTVNPEVEKFYIDATGKKRGPMKRGANGTFLSDDDDASLFFWDENGVCSARKYNLVAEWTGEDLISRDACTRTINDLWERAKASEARRAERTINALRFALDEAEAENTRLRAALAQKGGA